MDDITLRAKELLLEREAYLSNLYNDPVFFAQEIWHDRQLNRYGRLSRYERRLIRWTMSKMRGRKRIALAPRGIGKTYFVVTVGILWCLFRDPESKHLLVSKSEKHTKKTIYLLQEWIKAVPFLKHLYAGDGDISRSKRWTVLEFDVAPCAENRTPSVTGVGIEGQLPGSRAHVVWGDDIETDENSQTIEARESLESKSKEFSAIATYGLREIVIVGTTWHETESVYRKIAELRMEDGRSLYDIRTVPCSYPSKAERRGILGLDPQIVSDMRRGKAHVGDPVFPERMPRLVIAEKKALGKTYFLMQFQCLLIMGDSLRYPLKLSDLIVMPVNRDKAPISVGWGRTDHHNATTRLADIECFGFAGDGLHGPIFFDPQFEKYRGTIMWVDPSGEGVDKTAYAIGSQLNGYVWCHEVVGIDGLGYGPEALATICLAAKRCRVRTIYVEKTWGQGMFGQLLRAELKRHFCVPGVDPECPDGWTCDVVDMPIQGQGHKEKRILRAAEGPLQNHRVVIDPSVARSKSFQYQLAHIHNERGALQHDDEIEAFAMMLWCWREELSQNTTQAAERARQLSEQEALARDEALRTGRKWRKKMYSWFRH